VGGCARFAHSAAQPPSLSSRAALYCPTHGSVDASDSIGTSNPSASRRRRDVSHAGSHRDRELNGGVSSACLHRCGARSHGGPSNDRGATARPMDGDQIATASRRPAPGSPNNVGLCRRSIRGSPARVGRRSCADTDTRCCPARRRDARLPGRASRGRRLEARSSIRTAAQRLARFPSAWSGLFGRRLYDALVSDNPMAGATMHHAVDQNAALRGGLALGASLMVAVRSS